MTTSSSVELSPCSQSPSANLHLITRTSATKTPSPKAKFKPMIKEKVASEEVMTMKADPEVAEEAPEEETAEVDNAADSEAATEEKAAA